jgi:hypothetical protein
MGEGIGKIADKKQQNKNKSTITLLIFLGI